MNIEMIPVKTKLLAMVLKNQCIHTLPLAHYAANHFAGIVQLFWLRSLNLFQSSLVQHVSSSMILPKHACEPLWAAILVYSMYSVCQPTTIFYGVWIIDANTKPVHFTEAKLGPESDTYVSESKTKCSNGETSLIPWLLVGGLGIWDLLV